MMHAITRIAIIICVSYLLICLYFLLNQGRLIYFPEKLTLAELHQRAQRQGLRVWAATETDYRALVAAKALPIAGARGTILLFHGNATSAYHFAPIVPLLQSRGWQVVLAEYPGYAGRPGIPGEASIKADAYQTARLVQRDFPAPLVITGVSLGTGVACALSTEQDLALERLILITPFDSLEAVGAWHYPWLPVKTFMREKWECVTHLEKFGKTVDFVLAEKDEIIPAPLVKRILANNNQRTTLVKGAGHNDWFDLLTVAQWDEIFGAVIKEQ